MKNKIYIFDSTLRDGAQAHGISFSVEDKLKIVKCLDEIGCDFIEAGNPGSNPKDVEFFERINEIEVKNSQIVAFGATRKPNIKPEEDANIINLLKANTKHIAIFGKTWDFHVTDIIKTTLEENLHMIEDTIKYLKSINKDVTFDAEHFFDGYKSNKEYAIKALEAAEKGGADYIALCDTNGGSLPFEIEEITKDVIQKIKTKIGIHCHNDSGLAVANSIVAVNSGACQVQGTFIGYGERSGNANLAVIMPTLKFKLDYDLLKENSFENLTSAARYISEISNINLEDNMPYVGYNAFAHKGGMHIDGVLKDTASFEHIGPEKVGNERKFLVSEVSGKSTVLKKIQKIFPNITKNDPEVQKIIDRLKELEYEGYQFEGAESTVELIMRKIVGKYKPFFNLNHFKTIGEQPSKNGGFTSTAIVNISVDTISEITASEGEGPVDALDKALRKALDRFYPELKKVRLIDYKVRVIDTNSATGAKVRVLIESTDGISTWNTVGVSRDIIEASWIALVDSIEYKLIRDMEEKIKAYF